jgi:ribulose-phosphate 3-epimerase
MSIKVSPSILAADFGNLAKDCNKIDKSNADWFHLDVMDGLFVPNISFGMPVVKSIRELTKKPLDVHLMIVEPERYIDDFIHIGSDILTVHIEATTQMNHIINKVHQSSLKSGIAINPDTPISKLEKYICEIDLVCLMGVNPGFAGQKFIEKTYNRLEELKSLIISNKSSALIEVDGGVNKNNFENLKSLGADVLVAGSYIFNSSDYNAAIDFLK